MIATKLIHISLISILILMASFFSNLAYAQTYGSRLCQSNRHFDCYRVKQRDSWDRLFPDSTEREIVMKVNRMNTSLYPGMLIAIPKDLSSTNVMDYTPLPRQIEAPGTRMIFVSINPNVLAWGAYSADGTLENWGPVSAGRDWCPDINHSCHTATGKFSIYQKEGAGCKSTKFPVGRGGAPMPYCMFFHGGLAMHGSYEVPGYNDSHGCVRMFVPDAKWLNQEFTNGEVVSVIITKAT